MAHALDQLLDQYDKGLLNRRQLLKGLAVAIGAVGAAAVGTSVDAQGTGMFPLQQINHLNIMTSDVKKTAEFYQVVFGAKAQTDSPNGTQMSFPGATATSGCWISITAAAKRPEYDDAAGVPGLTHIGFGINENPADFPRMAAEVHERFPDLKKPNTPKMNNHPVGPYEAYLFDPNGIAIQLIRPEFDAAALPK